ncbi:MAG: rod-binding protein [Desulfobacteraceae bacterium]|jgi:flagellar protein FlgJ
MNIGNVANLTEAKIEYSREKFSGLDEKTGKNEDAKLKKACEDFEAIMIHQMLKAMRKTVPEGGILEKSHGTDIWESMYDEKISFEASDRERGTGLAMFLYKELSKGSNVNLKS